MIDECKAFLLSRNWDKVKWIWAECLLEPSIIADVIRGDDDYGLNKLDDIAYEGSEYSQSDRRKTFALQIGYLGWNYNGFQQQRGVANVYTVQDDLLSILHKPVVAAGRTDKFVSALSQIVSVHTFEEIAVEDIVAVFNESLPQKEGRLKLMNCTRVPRKFHALFSASWRRYIYLLPLNDGVCDGFDVDVNFISTALTK